MNLDAMLTSNFHAIALFDPGCWYKFGFLMTNSVDQDQMVSSKPTDLDLHL